MMLIFLPLLVTVNLFILSKPDIVFAWNSPWLVLSQLFSLLGTQLLCFSFILGSRARFLENIFGGLDKVIKLHHIVGGIAFVLLLHHPLFLAVMALPNGTLAWQYLFFSADNVYNFGVVALYLMIMLLLLTIIVKLPYDVWIKTHDFFGVVLFFACLHIFFITSDVSRYLPLRIWMFASLGVGAFFYIYKVFLYRWFGPKYEYVVEKINVINDILEIYLSPINESLRFKPGQFGFVSFKKDDLGEAHPFSFSSSPDESTVRLSIKILGDYTLKLKQLTVGTKCSLWGAYGRMFYGFYDKNDVVCIAGGVGITPFMSMINFEKNHPLTRKISLFYSAKSESEAIYNQDLIDLSSQMTNFHYFPNFSDQKPRLTCQIISDNIGGLKNKTYYLCGPPTMMHSLSDQLKESGVRSANIIFEDFAFKV